MKKSYVEVQTIASQILASGTLFVCKYFKQKILTRDVAHCPNNRLICGTTGLTQIRTGGPIIWSDRKNFPNVKLEPYHNN